MNVARLEFCRELQELSDWNDTYLIWMDIDDSHPFTSDGKVAGVGAGVKYQDVSVGGTDWLSAYDLGYLLRKLPPATYIFKAKEAAYGAAVGTTVQKYRQFADTPEDAACKLAIALFKQNILQRSTS